MPSLRQALAQERPHVAAKKAWNETIRALRMGKKQGIPSSLHDRQSVDRLLATAVNSSMDVPKLKGLLGQVLTANNDVDKIDVALAIDRLTAQWTPAAVEDPVLVRVEGWPRWVDASTKLSMTGLAGSSGVLPPSSAAALQFHLDGFQIGNEVLRVEIELPSGTRLPAPRRKDRTRNRSRGVSPWLPFHDEEGRYSATPRNLAMQHGRLMAGTNRTVVDPFCGLGGDAIGAAIAGARVLAFDADSGRLKLAKKNAQHFNVKGSIAFQDGDVGSSLANIDLSTMCLFLDPPWGGKNWSENARSLDQWLVRWPVLKTAIERSGAVLIKAPRTFKLESLSVLRSDWAFSVGVESNNDHPADQIRILRAFTC